MDQDQKEFLKQVWLFLKDSWLFLTVLIMSMLMKLYTMLKYRQDMTFMEFWVEFIVSAGGSFLTLYVMLKMRIHIGWFCGIGSVSGIAMAQIAKMVSKETSPILELIVIKIKDFIKNKNNEKFN